MIAYFALSYSPFSEAKMYGDYLADMLTSYHVIQDASPEKVRKFFGGHKMFLDSGAFTAFTKGVTIDIDKYIEFIKATEDVWEAYATLDVIGDWKATKANTDYMKSKGLKPVAVFHYGSPESELRRLIAEEDYIALGGLVPLSMQRKKMQAWLDYCFSIIQDKVKVHGLGVNSFWAWQRYPFYSVDATSWNQGSKFGRTLRPDGLKSKPINGEIDKFHRSKDWRHRLDYNISAYKQASNQVTKLWESRGVKWQ